MNSFPQDTRHRLHQLETTENVDFVTRKFLCTQLPKFIEWRTVYPFVSDDLDAIDFRAPGVLDDYACFRHVEPQELSDLVGNPLNLKKAREVPVFVDFCERVNPPEGKELVTFFAHGQLKKDLMGHLEQIQPDEKIRLAKALREYQVPEALSGHELAQTIGLFLSQMHVNSDNVFISQGQGEEGEEEEESDSEEELTGVLLQTAPPKEWKEEDHWENPILKAFKVNAGLSTQFSSEKTLKQMVISGSSSPGYNAPRTIMGKFQSEVPLVEDHSVAANVLVECAPTEAVEAAVFHPSVQRYYGRNKHFTENRALLKSFLQEHPSQVHHHVIDALVNAQYVF